jgi:MSHA pilin protein MshD
MSIRNSAGQRGLSLVEQIVFIVVVGVAVTGVLAAMNVATRGSADPMIQKQALAIAEAVLEEVQLQPFTYCDPDDTNAATALNAAGCTAGGAEAVGAEGAAPYGPETRTGTATPFDNVNDYNAFSMTGITDIAGNAIAGSGSYTATVAVSEQGMPAAGGKCQHGAARLSHTICTQRAALTGNSACTIDRVAGHGSRDTALQAGTAPPWSSWWS